MNFSRKLIAIIMCLVPLFVLLILFNYSFFGLPVRNYLMYMYMQCKHLKFLYYIPIQNQSTNQRAKTFPVLITVFYEALCPDSKYFLSKQMLPAFKMAASIMDVKLVPYGKATTSLSDGNLSFECQHGPTECQANIYHACAVDIIKDPLVRLEVISCMIRDNRFPQTAMRKVSYCTNIHMYSIVTF